MAKSDKEYIKQLEDELKQTKIELKTYKSEYKLAIAANRQLAANQPLRATIFKNCINCQEAVEGDVFCVNCHEEVIKRQKLLLFAFIRNSSVAPVGLKLGKSQQEITDKVFETIKEAEKIVDFEKMREFMNLASEKENRYDN